MRLDRFLSGQTALSRRELTAEIRSGAVSVNGTVITVQATRELRTKDGKAPALLEIAGEDGVFVPASGEIEGNLLRIRAEGTGKPVSARYAWTDWSDRANLCGLNGLPLEPFLV